MALETMLQHTNYSLFSQKKDADNVIVLLGYL